MMANEAATAALQRVAIAVAVLRRGSGDDNLRLVFTSQTDLH
jgi:hypothetical protein